MTKDQTPATLLDRITDYLGNGGLFNPEMMDHEKVRDLLADCREMIQDLAEDQGYLFKACGRCGTRHSPHLDCPSDIGR